MTDLERFFRRLVDVLVADDPARLHRPLAVHQVTDTLLPYRASRRSLALETNEDYDLVLLRLLGGEGGFFVLMPEELRARCAAEARSSNPDLNLTREIGRSEFTLGTEALAYALGRPAPTPAADPGPPPAPAAPSAPAAAPIRAPVPADEEALDLDALATPGAAPRPEPRAPVRRPSGPRCGFCGGKLPQGRTVNFCPHCGQNQSYAQCPACGGEIELSWKHCVSCGAAVGEG